jgi:hypothetical protein
VAKKPTETSTSESGAGGEKMIKKWDVKRSHKIRYTIITVLVTLLIVGVGAGAYVFFLKDTQTTISNDGAKPLVTTIKAPDAARAHFDEVNFSMDLPADWKRLAPETTGPVQLYRYQSGLKNAENRFLSVYVDRLPLTMAVNKEVAVSGEGTKLTHGNVSANCTEFTNKPAVHAMSAPAKWDGVDFLCDMDGTTRNIAGTSSPGNINKVELTNVGFTKHTFFFLYEDDNYNPDYGIFYGMLDSFSVK